MHEKKERQTQKSSQRLVRRESIRIAVRECELKTLAELYRRTRHKALDRLEAEETFYPSRDYDRISQWSDETFRKCLSEGHILYNVCLGLFCDVFAETGVWSSSTEEWAARIRSSSNQDHRSDPIPQKAPANNLGSSAVFKNNDSDLWSRYNANLMGLMEEPAPGSEIPISRLYVPLRAKYGDTLQRSPHLISFLSRKQQKEPDSRSNNQKVADDLATIIRKWLTEPVEDYDAIRLIRGGPGSGKSTFARALVSGYAFKESGSSLDELGISQSILISLQRVPSGLNSVSEIVDWFLSDPSLFNEGQPALTPPSTNKKLLLVFDGLDELSGGGPEGLKVSQSFIQSLKVWLRSRNANTINTVCVVVGRDFVVRRAEARLGLAPHQSLEILPYSINERGLIGEATTLWLDQRGDWWRKWASETAAHDELLPMTIRSHALAELSVEPLLLYIIASTKIYRQQGVSDASRYDVYEFILNKVTSNWHNRAGRQNVQFLSDPMLLDILELIASAAWRDGGRVTTIERVKEFSEKEPKTAVGVSELVQEHDLAKALLAFYFKLDDTEALSDVGLEFTHKSFCEFLIARRLSRQIQNAVMSGRSLLNPDIGLSTTPGG
mmetsp:Transcript_27743/g.51640  ORF Transcript_27743/g.51640 Transcript_27743/m.51640 type:complete len:610 (-) Transcript_27743:905-2734(-)